MLNITYYKCDIKRCVLNVTYNMCKCDIRRCVDLSVMNKCNLFKTSYNIHEIFRHLKVIIFMNYLDFL